MMFVEVFAPKGSLSEGQRRQITERMITEVMNAPSAPRSVIEAGQALCQVVLHEPDTWVVGGQPLDPGDSPRYVVRASIPGAWGDEMSGYLVSRFTQILADAEDDPEALYHEPRAWVHITPVAEGAYGTFGRVMQSNDLVRIITQSFRDGETGERPEAPPGSVIDPICGMTVPLNDDALTLEHDGTTHAFCSAACRTVYAEDHGVAIPQ